MSKTAKRVLAMLLACLMIVSVVGCGKKEEPANNSGNNASSENKQEQQQGSTDSDEPKNVVIAMQNEWETLNPYGSSGNYTDIISDQIFDRLLVTKFDGTTEPRLATGYEVADDKTSITFFLNKEAKFHDGEPVTADDVVFSAHLNASQKFNSLKRNNGKYFEGTDAGGMETSEGSLGIEKIDDYTVKFTFKTPMNELPVLTMYNRYFYIVPEHIFGEYTHEELNSEDVWKDNLIGSGPFMYDSHIDGSVVYFKANENYYLGAPQMDTLELRVVEASQMVAGMMAGEIDTTAGAGIGAIPLSDWGAAQELEGYTTYSGKQWAYQAMIFNTTSEKMPNKEIRQAINMAINRQVIVDTLIEGEASILWSPLPEYHPFWNPDCTPVYDPDTAKQMLTDAGYDFNQTLELIVPTGNEIRIQSTVLIQQDLEKVGVKVNITQYDFATLMQKMRDGDYDLGMCGSAGSIEPSEPHGWLNHASTTNFPCLQDTLFFDIYQDAINEVDSQKQLEKHQYVQEVIIDECPVAYLYSMNTLCAYNSEKLGNLDIDSFGNCEWQTWTWEVK